MNLKKRWLLAASSVALLLMSVGCSKAPSVNTPAKDTENSGPKASRSGPSPKDPPFGEHSPTADLSTPAEVFKAACESRQRKEIAELKKRMSKQALEFLKEMGEVEDKSLDQVLKELAEKPQGPCSEFRNERITGDWAVVEYKDEKGQWKTMDLEREDGEWKITIPKFDRGPTSETGDAPRRN